MTEGIGLQSLALRLSSACIYLGNKPTQVSPIYAHTISLTHIHTNTNTFWYPDFLTHTHTHWHTHRLAHTHTLTGLGACLSPILAHAILAIWTGICLCLSITWNLAAGGQQWPISKRIMHVWCFSNQTHGRLGHWWGALIHFPNWLFLVPTLAFLMARWFWKHRLLFSMKNKPPLSKKALSITLFWLHSGALTAEGRWSRVDQSGWEVEPSWQNQGFTKHGGKGVLWKAKRKEQMSSKWLQTIVMTIGPSLCLIVEENIVTVTTILEQKRRLDTARAPEVSAASSCEFRKGTSFSNESKHS